MKCTLFFLSILAANGAMACKPLSFSLQAGQSIREALQTAEDKNACAVKISLGAGSYMEVAPLEITRNTEIEGVAATAVDTNASFLNLNGKNLTIKRIKVVGAKDNAIVQSGGVLEIHNSSFLRTQAASSQANSGVAIVVNNGGVIKAAVTEFIENQNGAVLLTGKKTLGQFGLGSFLRNQILESNFSDEKIANQGAFRVSQGAEAYFFVANFEDNQILALTASGSNSKVYLRNATVAGTKSAGVYGGTGILMKDGAKLIIEKSKLSGNQGVGLSLNKGFATAQDASVENNHVGVAITGFSSATDYDAQSCLKIKYLNNEKQLDSSISQNGVKNPKSCPQFPWKWDANMRVYLR